jgi:hypothetical protein
VDDREHAKLVYILGSTRTGSGVFGRVLSTLEGATFAGELRRLWSRGIRPGRTCACGRPHLECRVWSRLLVPGAPWLEPKLTQTQRRAAPDSQKWWFAFRHLRYRSPPPSRTNARRYLDAYSELHKAFARVTDSSIVINSSKSAAEAALLLVAPDVNTFCIQMVRDPRAVAFSFRRHSIPEALTGSRPRQAVLVALRWAVYNVVHEVIRKRYGPERSLFVRYEDFIAEPRATVESAAKLIGAPVPLPEIRPGIAISVPEAHGPDGGHRRRFVGTEVVLELDDQWKRDLHPVDGFLVTLLALPLLIRYGYPISRRRKD